MRSLHTEPPNLTETIESPHSSPQSVERYDVVIVGAGAAGLMCAIEAGNRGRRVLVLEHANKVTVPTVARMIRGTATAQSRPAAPPSAAIVSAAAVATHRRGRIRDPTTSES